MHISTFRICKIIIYKAFDLQDLSMHVHSASVADIELLLLPAEYTVDLVPDDKVFGQAYKFINEPRLMPDLKWSVPTNTSISGKLHL